MDIDCDKVDVINDVRTESVVETILEEAVRDGFDVSDKVVP